jgi:2-oxoacid:acceptor oxidoreductase delta subunit (pyruvate/2-ketoisovalerate family)
LGDEKVKTIELVKTRTEGREKPVVIVKDSNFYIEADTVITATGQTGDLEPFGPLLKSERGMVVTDESRIVTDHPGLFAGGDVVTGPATVTEAIYWGRRAADAIRFYFEGQSKERVSRSLLDQYSEEKREKETSVSFEEINLKHFSKHHRFLNRANHSWKNIRMESERCFSCGTCSQCGICWIFCPDMAVTKTEQGYEIDYDYCKGCGICSHECPQAIIQIVEGKGGKGVSIK